MRCYNAQRYTRYCIAFQDRAIRCRLVVHLTLIHSRHREIGFYSFYRSSSSLRRRATFISARKARKRGRRETHAYDKLFPSETRRHFQSAIRRMTE